MNKEQKFETKILGKALNYTWRPIAAAGVIAGGVSGFGSVEASQETGSDREHKVNICHITGSESHPYEAINVDNHAFDGEGDNDHTKHGDFLYLGPLDKNEHPTGEGNEWCAQIQATPTPTPKPIPTRTPTATTIPPVVISPSPTSGMPEKLPPTGGFQSEDSKEYQKGLLMFGTIASGILAAAHIVKAKKRG